MSNRIFRGYLVWNINLKLCNGFENLVMIDILAYNIEWLLIDISDILKKQKNRSWGKLYLGSERSKLFNLWKYWYRKNFSYSYCILWKILFTRIFGRYGYKNVVVYRTEKLGVYLLKELLLDVDVVIMTSIE